MLFILVSLLASKNISNLNIFYCIGCKYCAGKNCDEVISLCHSGPCFNNGTCSGNINNYTCSCPYHWTGPSCGLEVGDI